MNLRRAAPPTRPARHRPPGAGQTGGLAVVLILAASAALASCASGHREPYPEDPPQLRSLSELEARLREAVRASDRLSLEEAGRVTYQGFEAPLWVVRFRPPEQRRAILVTGGIHGNEPEGTAWAVELVARLAARPESYPSTGFEIVPLVNPWGWSRDQRYNGDGRDINRDFASFATQEARLLSTMFATGRYDLAIDHHEDPDVSGVYLYQYAMRDRTVSRRALEAIRTRGYPLEQEVNMVILRIRDGLIDAPRWGLGYMRITRQLSLTNYLRLEHCERVYTVESPTRLPLAERLEIHRIAFELLSGEHSAAQAR